MATIVTRAGKGSPLTNNEVDQNFINLNTDKLEGTVAIASGGTGQTTQQAAINALAGAVTTGQYLRGNGTNVVMSAIQAGDVPTLNQNTTGTAANVTGTVAIANGGTGQTTKTAAFDALSPVTTKGDLIAFDGTDNVRLGVGTDDFVLTADSTTATGLAWKAAAGGSSVLTISNKTAAYTVVAGDLGTIINCTANTFTVSLTAASSLGAGFNCSIWNTGTGTITIDPAGSETIDARVNIVLRAGEGTQIISDGTNWQTGNKKTMRGYAENLPVSNRPTASGSNSLALLGGSAGGIDALGFGLSSSASTNYTVAIGRSAAAQGDRAIGIGWIGQAGASDSIAIGDNQALETNTIAMGRYARATERGRIEINTTTGFGAPNYGAVQMGFMMLIGTTSNATPLTLTSTTAAAAITNTFVLTNNAAYHVKISVIGRQDGASGTQTAAYEFTAVVRRASGEATTTLLNSTKTVLFESTAGWDCNISANTTNGALDVTVTGAAATNIRWAAKIESIEINSHV